MARFERMAGRFDGPVVAVNDVGVVWSRPLAAWTSLHPDKLLRGDPRHPDKLSWVAQREAAGHPMDFRTFSKRGHAEETVLDGFNGGSSGLLAVQVAAQIGCDLVVLCGVPMSKRPHFKESIDHDPLTAWRSADSHWRAWKNNQNKLHGWVRSMSGRTRDTFGAPTLAWLRGDDT